MLMYLKGEHYRVYASRGKSDKESYFFE